MCTYTHVCLIYVACQLNANPSGACQTRRPHRVQELELQRASDNNYIPISLGPRVLRTETAVVCSLSNAQQLWGDLH